MQNKAKESIDDEAIKRAAELLLKGAIMLNKACPHCKTPLYKYEGRILCPTCQKEYIIANTKKELEKLELEKKEKKIEERKIINEKGNVEITETLKAKLQLLNNQLKEAQDPKKIAEIAKAIKSITEAIQALE